MVPKDSYALLCHAADGKIDVIYPTRYVPPSECPKGQYVVFVQGPPETEPITDFADVKKYITERNLVGKYVQVYIAKIRDGVQLKMDSVYKEEGKK